MDKKSILAFVIIFLIILAMPGYFKLINGPSVSDNEGPATPVMTQPEKLIQKTAQKTLPQKRTKPLESTDKNEHIITIETDLYRAEISSIGGGTVKSFQLKKYEEIKENDTTLVQLIKNPEEYPLLIGYISIDGDSVWLNQNFTITDNNINPDRQNKILLIGNDSKTITFTLKTKGSQAVATKSLTFYGNSYNIDINTDLRGLRPEMATNFYNLTWNSGLNYTEPNVMDETRYSKAYAYSGGETEALNVKNGRSDESHFTGQTDWTAIRTKYFSTAFISYGSAIGYQLTARGIPLEGKNYYKKYSMQLSLPSDKVARTVLYIGPLEYSTIKKLGVDLENIMSLGRLLRPISKGILWLFIRLHTVIPNYGWVLIIFAFLVKIVLYPLTNKSMQSMKEMQNLQPKIEELRKKYPNDPQKMNAAQMKLYKEHGVNPMGGCLPLLLQMPILIALFTVFRTTIELRHAPFIFWITDLSAPDTIFTLPFSIPIYGKHVNVLPIIMALSTILQQKLSTSSSANPQQKMMTYLMPVMFFFMFNQFPSGLNLYYTLFNLLTVAQQKFIPSKPKKRKRKRPSTIEAIRQFQSKTKHR